MASISDLLDLVIIGGISFGVYYTYKTGDLQKFIDFILHGGGNGPGPGPGPGGSACFGSGQVSLHGLQSGGSAWRKEWECSKRYLNCEFEGFFKIPSGNDGISIKLRGGPHSGSGDNATTRQGCCYIFTLPFNGSNKDNFQKECPHPDYAKHTIPVKFSAGSIIGKNVGIRVSTVNEGKGVRCRMSLNTNGSWREWYNILDTGQYGQSSAQSPPFTRSPMYGNTPRVGVRIDATSKSQASGYQMSGATIREIGSSGLAQVQQAPVQVQAAETEVLYYPTSTNSLVTEMRQASRMRHTVPEIYSLGHA